MATFPPILSMTEYQRRTKLSDVDLRRLQGASSKKVAADSLALDVQAETVFRQWKDDGTVTELVFVPDATVAADPANFATITVYKRTGSGAPVTIGSVDSHALGWFNGVPVVIPITVGAIANGDTLSWAIAKSGTGVLLPTGELFVSLTPNYVDTSIADRTEEIYDQLAKRYDVPFASPVPSIVKRWCAALVDRDCYGKRGAQPSNDTIDEDIEKAATRAEDQIQKAADAVNGLYDLPLRADAAGSSAVDHGGPFGYSETSPYVWPTEQAAIARQEDRSGTGSSND